MVRRSLTNLQIQADHFREFQTLSLDTKLHYFDGRESTNFGGTKSDEAVSRDAFSSAIPPSENS